MKSGGAHVSASCYLNPGLLYTMQTLRFHVILMHDSRNKCSILSLISLLAPDLYFMRVTKTPDANVESFYLGNRKFSDTVCPRKLVYFYVSRQIYESVPDFLDVQ